VWLPNAGMVPPPSARCRRKDFPVLASGRYRHCACGSLAIASSDLYSQVFATVARASASRSASRRRLFLASALGLAVALMALSGSIWLRQTARFYVEIIRGIPILVLLFWIAFAGAPVFVADLELGVDAVASRPGLTTSPCWCGTCR
jgi:polar amino acid transport system permease protein